MKKNYSLEFYRVIFTIVICFHHAQYFITEQSWLRHAYICVEFFFILSGYLLYISFKNERAHSTYTYVFKRYERLWPEYAFAAIVAILGRGVFLNDFSMSKAVNELFMVQNTGLFHLGGYNYPCWYIPVMLFCGIFLYSLLSLWPKHFAKLIGPAIVLLGYTYIWGLDTGLENWQYIGPVSVPIVRGFAAMTVGILLAIIQERGILRSVGARFATVMEICSLALIGVGIATDYSTDMLTVCAFAALVLLGAEKKGLLSAKVFDKPFWGVLGEYSYSAYLNHAMVIYVLSYADKHMAALPCKALIFFVALCVYTFCTKHLIAWIRGHVGKFWEK